jgi:hypothetical protein
MQAFYRFERCTEKPLSGCFQMVHGTGVASSAAEVRMADDEQEDMITVPIPSSETEAEHKRVRNSNDRDQQLEREGKPSRHNRGYDEAADGAPHPEVQHVVDEE